ncbi:rhodanese-like domain-containing protein [Fontimonas sp. SYSU GA230001]|uniref:rhodanese-like domain-containing protein n=1 Tax=Fontimonas sp. SYSU GA230001 TaxID=3142450 RepID=UPI0032B41A23
MADHSPAFVALVDAARQHVREIDAHAVPQLLERRPGLRLIDVRERCEFDAGHVRDAEWIGKGIIERDIEQHHPDRNEPLYLYCGGGYRSVLAAESLQKMGYRNVWSIAGGWRALKDLLPVA